MTRVVVMGSGGQLGTEVVKVFSAAGTYTVFPLSHAEVECTDSKSVRLALETAQPDVVVNCVGYVRVDDCEERPEEAFRVNAYGSLYVAQVCAGLNAMCVYISTDYVFDGDKGAPYTEEDPPSPINIYGASKLAGEHLVRQTCARWMIVRLASLFGGVGARSKGGNFVDTVLEKARRGAELNIVGDIRMTPVYAYDAARSLQQLIRQQASGIFHIANRGSCTWYDFACRALELAGLSAQVQRVSSSEYPCRARRPRDSSLASVKWQPAGDDALRPWPEALRAYLEEKYQRSPSQPATSNQPTNDGQGR